MSASHELPHEIFMLFKDGVFMGRTSDPREAYHHWRGLMIEKDTTGAAEGCVEVMNDTYIEVLQPSRLHVMRWKRYGFDFRGH
jgi:hypothetical protein